MQSYASYSYIVVTAIAKDGVSLDVRVNIPASLSNNGGTVMGSNCRCYNDGTTYGVESIDAMIYVTKSSTVGTNGSVYATKYWHEGSVFAAEYYIEGGSFETATITRIVAYR